MLSRQPEDARINSLLRTALLANAIYSAASGLAALIFASGLSGALLTLGAIAGISTAVVLGSIGAGLVAFAIFVGWVARNPVSRRGLVILITVLDTAWVVLAAGLLGLTGQAFTNTGVIVVIATAIPVGLFAVVQMAALTSWRSPAAR
ncbi:hypothetical protein ACFPB0_00765 [Glycocaulis abyssi]|uniref:Uncharacterized protein n=2 Tax=Glycocaulis abyssi TaxID=1433403 RepID=A0ABV9N834_9PROT